MTETTTAVAAGAIKLIKDANPGLRLIVRFADEAHAHVGALYQAANWTYTGTSQVSWYVLDGKLVHAKAMFSKYYKINKPVIRQHDPNFRAV